MSAPDLARAACTVECFLNAMRMEDGPERTALEEKLVRWLTRNGHQKGDCLTLSAGKRSYFHIHFILKSKSKLA